MENKILNLQESIDFLNIECGYIDVENDDDYTNEEIINIANSKYEEMILPHAKARGIKA